MSVKRGNEDRSACRYPGDLRNSGFRCKVSGVEMKETKKGICVVLVVEDLGYGGAEGQVVELANNLDRDRFDVHVCSLSDHVPLSRKLRNAKHRFHVINRTNSFDVTLIPRLARLLRVLRADIVHGYLFSAEIISRLAGRIAGTRLVVGSERNANRPIRKIHILGLKFTHRCVNIIVANSKAGAESNAKVFNRPASDYRVVHNGVDTERFRPADGTTMRQEMEIPVRCPVVGVFANFKPQKNHAMLFRAFRLVLDSLPDARLLLVGDQPFVDRGKLDDYQAQLERLIDDVGIRDRCVFLGHQEDTEHLYPICDITVLPSIHEGTPNALLESMACGVPVIATNVGDNGYIVREGEVGYLVAVGNETDLAHHIKLLLRDDTLRQRMRRKARHWVLSEFSIKRFAEKMASVYMDSLNDRPK